MEFTKGYFSVIDWALNERGVACIQAITIPEARFEKCKCDKQSGVGAREPSK